VVPHVRVAHRVQVVPHARVARQDQVVAVPHVQVEVVHRVLQEQGAAHRARQGLGVLTGQVVLVVVETAIVQEAATAQVVAVEVIVAAEVRLNVVQSHRRKMIFNKRKRPLSSKV
jgi:hypothetical protein